jgi:hypothetical protein
MRGIMVRATCPRLGFGKMSTGSRDNIYDKIDGLSKCETMSQLIPKLQAILSNMAYYVINSDGAILETHEEWQTDFTERLRSDVGAMKDAKKLSARQQRGPRASPPGDALDSESIELAGEISLAEPVAPVKPTRAKPKKSREKGPAPPGGARPAQLEDVPASLLAIMNGSHPSLRQEDDDESAPLSRFGIKGGKKR